MGRFFAHEFESQRVYCCATCDTSLAPAESLVSKVKLDRGRQGAEQEAGGEKRRGFLFPGKANERSRERESRRRHAEKRQATTTERSP